MKWIYRDTKFNENLANLYMGFVYKITHIETGKIYIGKKNFRSDRKMNAKELKECEDKRRKRIRKDSNWRTYNSSCKELQGDISAYGESAFNFEILHLCETAITQTYYEYYYQFAFNVLLKDSYNENIGGKFFKGRIK